MTLDRRGYSAVPLIHRRCGRYRRIRRLNNATPQGRFTVPAGNALGLEAGRLHARRRRHRSRGRRLSAVRYAPSTGSILRRSTIRRRPTSALRCGCLAPSRSAIACSSSRKDSFTQRSSEQQLAPECYWANACHCRRSRTARRAFPRTTTTIPSASICRSATARTRARAASSRPATAP